MHEHQTPYTAAEPALSHETDQAQNPAIYVASLTDYTNGRLHGTWIDATRDPAAIQEEIAALLTSSSEANAEEYAIHDYSGFGSFQVGEYESLDVIHKIACGITKYGQAFTAYAELVGTGEASDDGFIDAYRGSYATFRDFADEFKESAGWDEEIDRFGERTGLAPFIAFDYDTFESTLRSDWHVADDHDGVHIFSL